MAFSNSLVSFTVLFSPAADKKSGTVTITSTSPFVANGIALADVVGAVNAFSPDGGQFNAANLGSPDIADYTVSRSATFNLPLDVNGFVQEGNYQFQLLERVSGAVDPADYNSNKLPFELCIVCPTPDVTWDIDCLCGKVTVRDTTDYSGWTTSSRTLTLRPPGLASQTHAPIVSTTTVVDTTGEDIYNGTYSLRLQWTGTKDGLECSIDETFENVVDCDFDLCSLQCCLEAVFTRSREAAAGNGGSKDKQYWQNVFEEATAYVVGIRQAYECGSTDLVQEYIARFRAITNCTSGCGCSDGDVPQRIVPICSPASGSAITVQGDGTYIEVSVLGSVYTVTITQLYRDILNNVFNTVVTSSTLTVTPSTVAGSPDTTTYNVEVPASLQPIDYMQIVLTLTFVNGNTSPSAALSTPTIRGTKFQSPTTITFSTSTPDSIILGGFYTGSPGTFVVQSEILDIDYDAGTTSGTGIQQYSSLRGTVHTWGTTNLAVFGLTQIFPTVGAYDTWFRWSNVFDSISIAFTFTEVN